MNWGWRHESHPERAGRGRDRARSLGTPGDPVPGVEILDHGENRCDAAAAADHSGVGGAGIFAMVMLATPGTSGDVLSDWIVLIGLALVVVTGLIYMMIARPGRSSHIPEGDAIEIADLLRQG